MNRQRILKEVFDAVHSQLESQPTNSPSVYLSGCRGMGKTSDLLLIARELKCRNWEVYFFKSAASIPVGVEVKLAAYALQNKSKNIAVIVDEVCSNPNSPLFVEFLKGELPNVLTIGAAVPRYNPSITAIFRDILHTTDLVLRVNDEDVVGLIEHWQSKDVATLQMVMYVSQILLNHCGGHVYPVLAFMEYFFTDSEAQKCLTDEKKFVRYFFSAKFRQTLVYRDVCKRCYFYDDHHDSVAVGGRLLSGKEEISDSATLARLGWWDSDRNDFISALLLNNFFSHVKIPIPFTEKIYLRNDNSQEQNLEILIIEGLSNMEPHELTCTDKVSGWPIENALSFNWACRVKHRFANVHIEFQKRFGRNSIDFYVNGIVDAGLEVLRNATQTAQKEGLGSIRQSQDIDEHLNRFLLSTSYRVDHFALLNFAMDAKGRIVLPREVAYHNRVYTYQHSTNSLYRGNTIIRAPAVAKLPCRTPMEKFGEGQRGYSTAVVQILSGVSSFGRLFQIDLRPSFVFMRGFSRRLLLKNFF